MYIIRIILLLQAALLMVACNDSASLKKEITTLDKEILRIHDEAMPHLSKILTLKKKINAMADSTTNRALKDSLQQVSFLLYKADKKMMDWMHGYKIPENATDSVVLHYLKNEKVKIDEVHRLTFESIEKARFYTKSK